MGKKIKLAFGLWVLTLLVDGSVVVLGASCPERSFQTDVFSASNPKHFQVFDHHNTIEAQRNVHQDINDTITHYDNLISQAQATDIATIKALHEQCTGEIRATMDANPLTGVITCECTDGYTADDNSPSCVPEESAHSVVEMSMGGESMLKFDVITNETQQTVIQAILDRVFPSPNSIYETTVLMPDNYDKVFPDIIDDAALHGAVLYLYGNGFVGGRTDGGFDSVSNVNRAEASKFLLKAAGITPVEVTTPSYPDVLANQWYTNYIEQAVTESMLSADGSSNLRPDEEVNVAEFLKMITKAFDLTEETAYTYTDVVLADWFHPYAGVAQTYNLFDHDDGGLLEPAKVLTRGEVALAIYRYLTY